MSEGLTFCVGEQGGFL